MKQVFQINIQTEGLNADFYFESQDAAESAVLFLESLIDKKAKGKLKITANICQVHTKESAIEQMLIGLHLNDPREIN